MIEIEALKIDTVSMITKDNLQLVVLEYKCNRTAHLFLNIYNGGKKVADRVPVAFAGGKGRTHVLLPVQNETFNAVWMVMDRDNNLIYETNALWKKPREWTFYIMISSHTDIGLHNSQYIQRFNSCKFTEAAMKLCDETKEEKEENQYRYTIEGTWFLNNYGMDRSLDDKKILVDNYIKQDKIGVCCMVAGNHIQTYGLEEMCRSAYEKKRLLEEWGISSETMSMIDNNGLPMSLIQPYSEAGIKNIIFAPNQWNPLPSTVWQMDRTISPNCTWSSNARGGGSRVDVSYDSELPMVFYWEDENKNRILVWGSTQYVHGSEVFGINCKREFTVPEMEQRIADILPDMESRYPYDVWLSACYDDDQEPSLTLIKTLQEWNEKWKFPQIRALGNPDKPFNILRNKYADKIPVLKGDITGGWYQHPISAPELLAKKFEADRALANAEKWAVIAALTDDTYKYPATDFRKAWDYLLYNDEHSYGTSGYQGRRVYETWMQHKDWIDKAAQTAQKEMTGAVRSIASKIMSSENKTVVFNPTLQTREERIEKEDTFALVTVPPLGYAAFSDSEFSKISRSCVKTNEPPQIENAFYKISFSDNGAIQSIFDKDLNRELLDKESPYGANALVYTKDNHKTFHVPDKAEFEIITEQEKITVLVKTKHQQLKCSMVQKIVLLNFEKRIDIDNEIYHAKDMINKDRYFRYIYFAFPFLVENAKRFCHLNGTVAEYAKDVTGHGTDVYMAVNEWCCCENEEFGAALLMLDTQLVEFDRIHPDKTDFANAGVGSHMYVYAANDWLQMHTPGGSHLHYRFRYSITSYSGDYKTAKIPQAAERYANPVYTLDISAQKGVLPENAKSFTDMKTDLRLLSLKRADDGKGIIARFYGADEKISISEIANIPVDAVRNTIDERAFTGGKSSGFITYRLGAEKICLEEDKKEEYKGDGKKPAPIGAVYTGLITEPRAARGETSGQLYLLWGHNMEPDFSHYKLYRSEKPDFDANEHTFAADVFPEEYVVGRYVDTGLKPHTCYYYKVCAVNHAGVCGEMSKVFSAYTKEETEE